jgi:uncharacterized membrane protein
MKRPVVAKITAFLGLGAWLSAPLHAQQQSSKFQLAFCNISTFNNVRVALAYRQDAQQWVLDGWYPVPDGGCTLLGSFLRDTIYYYAENDRGVKWRSSDTDKTAMLQCIDHEKAFRATASVPACPADQEPARFRMIKISPNQARLTWTLSGGRQ